MKCPYCKKEIPDQAKFCGFCGEKIGDSVNYTKSEPQMTKRRKKSWLILLVLVIVAAVGIGIGAAILLFFVKTQKGEVDNMTVVSSEEETPVPEEETETGTQEEDSVCTLIGVLEDQESKEKLTNVSMHITNTETGDAFEVITDENGAFSSELMPGTYLLTAELEGYENLEQNLTIDKDIDAGTLKLESIRVKTVSFDHQYRDDKEAAVIKGLDKDGNAVWSITTGEYPVTQLEGVQEIGIRGNRYYYVEDAGIIVLNLSDGTECWRNSDFSGGSISFDFGPDDTLYICGAFSPDFFAVDRNGNTLKKIVTFNEKFYWPYKVEHQENQVAVSMDGGPNGDDANVVFYVNLKDYSYEYSYMEDGLSEEQIASIRGQLGVPSDPEITCEQSEKYYWDTGERWLIYVSFVKDGKTVASADVDAETEEFIRNILNYSN